MDIYQAIELSPLHSDRIKFHLNKVREAQVGDGDLGSAISAAIEEFNQFFLSFGKPYFKVNLFRPGGHNAKSHEYNETMLSLKEDIETLYKLVKSAASTTLSAYNYSVVTAEEIKNSAAQASSKVLDLNILNNFVKGTVIIAGDDFLDQSKIDTSVQAETTQAELLEGASAVALKAEGVNKVSLPNNTTIKITPVAPAKSDGSVNSAPTPQNVRRFYEGHFYAPIGEIRPEGGKLKFKYIVDPSSVPTGTTKKIEEDGEVTKNEGIEQIKGGVGFFAIIPPSEQAKKKIRKYMLDGDPQTFWECEFVYSTNSLLSKKHGGLGSSIT